MLQCMVAALPLGGAGMRPARSGCEIVSPDDTQPVGPAVILASAIHGSRFGHPFVMRHDSGGCDNFAGWPSYLTAAFRITRGLNMITNEVSDGLAGILRTAIVELVRRDGPDLSARQLGVFLTCYLDSEAQTVRGLAAKLGVSKPAITRALDRLSEFDLV